MSALPIIFHLILILLVIFLCLYNQHNIWSKQSGVSKITLVKRSILISIGAAAIISIVSNEKSSISKNIIISSIIIFLTLEIHKQYIPQYDMTSIQSSKVSSDQV